MIEDSSQHLLLLVDNDDNYRHRIARILGDYGFEVLQANSAPSALEVVSRRRPALCILETNLPGVDGIQLLRYFRSRHLFRLLPVVVLSSGINKSDLASLIKLDVKGVFVKSEFSLDSLMKRVTDLTFVPEAFSVFHPESSTDSLLRQNPPSSHHQETSSETEPKSGVPPTRLLDRHSIESLSSLKTISVILEDLVAVASRSSSSLEDLESVIRKDPIVAARLIKAANSAAFLRGSPATRIEDSLRVLGFTNVLRVAVAGGCLSKDELEGEAGPDLKEIWANSLCTAMVCERLSSRQEAARYYMQGILCNLPIIFLIQFLGTDWFTWKSWAAEKRMTFGELVEASTSMPLYKFVEEFFQSLKISPDLSRPLVEYFGFFLTRSHDDPGRHAKRIDLAMQLGIVLGREGCDLHQVRPLSPKELKGEDISAIVNPAFAQEVGLIEASIGFDSQGRHADHAEFGRLLLWRDPRWSEIDPVAAYLENFAECIVIEDFVVFQGMKGHRIAYVEPGTPEWAALEHDATVFLLHTEAAPASTRRPAASIVKAPLCMRDLLADLTRFFETGSGFA